MPTKLCSKTCECTFYFKIVFFGYTTANLLKEWWKFQKLTNAFYSFPQMLIGQCLCVLQQCYWSSREHLDDSHKFDQWARSSCPSSVVDTVLWWSRHFHWTVDLGSASDQDHGTGPRKDYAVDVTFLLRSLFCFYRCFLPFCFYLCNFD